MTARISVIIPARNEEADLPLALDAIAAQTVPMGDVEVVVVDGDSTDLTATVAKEQLGGMGLARWDVVPNPGGNTPSNLNVGLRWCLSDYVVRVDARSHIPADYIERTVAVLASNPDVVVVGGSQVARRRDESLTARAIEQALNNPLGMGGSKYRRHGAISGPADTVYLGVFRREDLATVDGWNEQFSTNQDFELNRRLGATGTVWFEQDLPVQYVPRRTVRELALQYHRFGRWKSHYWRHTGNSPQPRQLALLGAVPVVGSILAMVLAVLVGRRRTVAASLGIAAFAAHGVRPVTVRSWLVNVVVGLAWWSGVVRGLIRDSVR